MIFRWKAVLLAPLAFPLLCGLGGAVLGAGSNPLSAFFVLFAFSAVATYGATVLLLGPCLFLLVRLTTLNRWKVGLLGLILGLGVLAALTVVSYHASGPDSGPPVETFGEFLSHWLWDPFNLLFPFAGLVTAATYWELLTLFGRREGKTPG